MAKHVKLTEERQQRVIEALNNGNYQDTAARYAGIDPATFYRWLEKGRAFRLERDEGTELDKEQERFVDFMEAVEKARANAEMRNVQLIQAAAVEGTWQAAGWWLERSFPQKWSRHERLEHSGVNGEPVMVNISVDDLESKVAALLKKRETSTDNVG